MKEQTDINKEIYQSALDKWGNDSQMNMMIEECAELIVAINHFKREKDVLLSVIEELADVEIMLEQMSIIFDRKHIKRIKNKKIERLAKRLNIFF